MLLALAAVTRVLVYVAVVMVCVRAFDAPWSVVWLIAILGFAEVTLLRWLDRRAGVTEMRERVASRFFTGRH